MIKLENYKNDTSIKLTKKQKLQVAEIKKVENGYCVELFPPYVFYSGTSRQVGEIIVKTVNEVKQSLLSIGEYVDFKEVNALEKEKKVSRLIKNYKFSKKFGYVEELPDLIKELEENGVNINEI